jgi:hypothetical protein
MKRLIQKSITAIALMNAMLFLVLKVNAELPCDPNNKAPKWIPKCEQETTVTCTYVAPPGLICFPLITIINIRPAIICHSYGNEPQFNPECRKPNSNEQGLIYCSDAFTVSWPGQLPLPILPVITPVLDDCYDKSLCTEDAEEGTCKPGVYTTEKRPRMTHFCCIPENNVLITIVGSPY